MKNFCLFQENSEMPIAWKVIFYEKLQEGILEQNKSEITIKKNEVNRW